jgi:hypothetical protein
MAIALLLGACCQAAEFVDRMGACPHLEAQQLLAALEELPDWEIQSAGDHVLRSYHWKRGWQDGATLDVLCRRGEREVHLGMYGSGSRQRLVMYTAGGVGLREDLDALHGAVAARVVGMPALGRMQEFTNLPSRAAEERAAFLSAWGGLLLLCFVLICLGLVVGPVLIVNADLRAHPRQGLHLR